MPVRPAVPDDASTLASLLGELGYPAEEGQVRARMTRVLESPATDSVLVATAEQDTGVVGLLSLHKFWGLHDDAPVALITALVVAERARGLGVGRALVDTAIDIGRRWGCARLLVTTHNRRAGAHAFYEHLGFEFTGRRYVRVL